MKPKYITLKYLSKIKACTEAVEEYKQRGIKKIPTIDCLELLIAENKLDWANWLIVKVMTRKQKIKYTIYAAEQVISIYEAKYPNDNRPRAAIEAAKTVLAKDTKKNRKVAYAAARAAYDAAYAVAYAAADAAYVTADDAARAAYDAAYDAVDAAVDDAACAAARAAYDAAYTKMKKQILEYGIMLLKEV